MPAPLIGAAAAVAARVVAKKLATKAVKKTVKKVAEPKSAVKVVKGNSGPNANYNELIRKGFNKDATNTAVRRKSGELARTRASQVEIGSPKTTVKINSGNTTRTPSKPAKAKSYWELKGLPSLVKINSGTGNKTVSPITYRGKATKATPAKRATGRRGQ
jgi:hypothetical protein